MTDTPDAYKVLQVDPDADPEVIQAAYRRLAQKYHPDLAGDANSDEGREAMARMVAINAAWAVLRDPQKRADYNRERAARVRIGGAATAGAGGGDRSHSGTTASSEPRSGATPASGQGAPPTPSGANQSSWSGRVSSAGRPATESTGGSPTGSGASTGAAGPAGQPTATGPLNSGSAAAHAAAAPGRPSGSVLNFGRYAGWSVGQIGGVDPEYLEWLLRAPIGRPYTDEVEILLRKLGRVAAVETSDKARRGLFRRR